MKILKRYTKKSKTKAVAMVKGHAYDDLYARLEIKEGEKELYRLARQRDRARKDVQDKRVIKDKNGNAMVNSEAVLFNSIQFIYLGFSQNNKSGKENRKQIKEPWSSKKTKPGHLVTGP